MFERPSVKPCAEVVQLVEAPFPNVSHVRQECEESAGMGWHLPMVRNRFVKEEYFTCNGKLKLLVLV